MKTGREPFNSNGKELDRTLLDFWRWSSSDILNNALRGVLAEYIVALDLDCEKGIRKEWDAYDLLTPGGVKVEVKSASYLQSWEQEKHSVISFGIRPTYGWDAETNTRVGGVVV